jgi:hypothetical protein
MKLILHRMVEGDGWTLGRLEDEEKRLVCYTAERAWVDKNGDGIGDTGVSRIPQARYQCGRDMHNKSGPAPYECWEVNGVPGRSEIHIHRGTDAVRHSKGCILVGTAFGVGGTVVNSAVAFEKLMKLTAGLKELTLEVRDVPHPACEEGKAA